MLFHVLARENRSASDAGVIAEFGDNNLDPFHGAGHRIIFGGLGDYGGHLVGESFHHTTAKNDDFRAENVYKVGHADAYVFGNLLYDLGYKLVAAADGFSQGTAAHVVPRIAEQFG